MSQELKNKASVGNSLKNRYLSQEIQKLHQRLYLGSFKTSMMELIPNIINGKKLLTIFARNSIKDV